MLRSLASWAHDDRRSKARPDRVEQESPEVSSARPHRSSDPPVRDWRPRSWPGRGRSVDLSGSGDGSGTSAGPVLESRGQDSEFFGFLVGLGDLENEYRLHHLSDDAAQSRIAYFLWLVSSITLVYFDYLVLGPTRAFATMVAVRVIFACALIGSLLIFRHISTVRHYDWMTLGVSLVMAAFVYSINASRPPDYFANFVLDILFPLSMYLVVRNRLLFCTIAACAFSAVDLFSLIADRHAVPPMFRNVVIASHVLANIMGFLVAAEINSFRRRAYRLYCDEISSRRLIERIASVDDLTGSVTRRSFLEALDHEMLRSRRFGRSLTIVVMDLDGFKKINDSHGHYAGDELLRHFASTVTSQKREIDVFGRLGGEEFCLMLPETSLDGAALVAERVRETWASFELPFDGVPLRSTVSLGVATLAATDDSYHSLLRRADGLLYDAKHLGRNRVVIESGSSGTKVTIGSHAVVAGADESSDETTGASPRFSSN